MLSVANKPFMLSVVMLSVANKPFMLSVVMLSVANKPFMLSVVMLSVIMLNVVMLNVVAPCKYLHQLNLPKKMLNPLKICLNNPVCLSLNSWLCLGSTVEEHLTHNPDIESSYHTTSTGTEEM